MRTRGVLVLLLFVALLGATRLCAHNAPGSAVLLDFHANRVQAELRLPLSELELSFHQPLEAAPATVATHFRDSLAAYVVRHIDVRAADNRAWNVRVLGMHVALAEQPIDLVVNVELLPPAGAPLRHFTLTYDVISHEVMNHIVLVSVRTDWDRAQLGGQPEILAALRSFSKALVVDRAEGHWTHGFAGVFRLGAAHIAEGTDHLLFLLVLLLPAPLLAGARRWEGCGGLRHTALRIVKIVTAFTLGHSLTLAFGALGWLRVPGQPIEVLIAVSILVSAVHAWRPVFPGRETWIAAGFGLVHGLAFATVLAGFTLSPGRTALALLGFNLGIEAMQLAVVAATVPWLVLLSSTRVYPSVRIGGALFAAAAALSWITERAFGFPSPLNAMVEAVAAHALWSVGVITAIAVSARFWPRRPRSVK